MGQDADLLETPLEDLRDRHPEDAGTRPCPGRRRRPRRRSRRQRLRSIAPSVYLVYDQRDAAVVSPWADFLFEQGCRGHLPGLRGRRGRSARIPRGEPPHVGRRRDFLRRGQRALAAPQVPRAAEDRRVRPHEAGAGRRRLPAAAEDPGEGALPHARGHRRAPVGRPVAGPLAADHRPSRRADRVQSVSGPSPVRARRRSSVLRPGERDRRAAAPAALHALPVGGRHVRQRQVVAGSLGTHSVALQRIHGHGGFELARGDVPARRRSDRPPGRGARPVRRARRRRRRAGGAATARWSRRRCAAARSVSSMPSVTRESRRATTSSSSSISSRSCSASAEAA